MGKIIAQHLKTDDEIREAFENENMSIFFRDGDSGNYELVDGYELEDVLDATVHGFEFIAVDGLIKAEISPDEIDLVEKDSIER